MLRALFTAVTGVRAHQTMLDVTGNNISNVNTTGFKKDNTIFADLMYQANKYAAGAGETRGGINPAQVGLGVSVSAIETIHTQGSGQYTGNAADMMIQDKGFFVYSNGGSQLFSRSGALTLDGNSDMVMSGTGYKLQGYQFEETPLDGYKQASSLSTINIPLGQKIDAHATSRVDYQCNLNSESSAYLSYGFADIPYNAMVGHSTSKQGYAVISMNGTDYNMSFTTSGLDLNASALPYNQDGTGTGVRYLDVRMSSGGATTVLSFDMVNIDKNDEGTGLPNLSLPKININTEGEYVMTSDVGTSGFVGWLDQNLNFVNSIDGDFGISGTPIQSELDKYMPVYQFPGQTPPQYFAVQYDDDAGTMKIRNLTFADAGGNDLTSQTTTAGLESDIARWMDESAVTIRATASEFTYNIKSNMNYTNFKLEGAPSVMADGDDNVSQNVSYNFIAEFDERAADTGSNLSKTASKLTLWYYGWSNADWAASNYGEDEAPVERMHKLEATVYFNADGTFDSVEWSDVNNNNAPLGYRIVDGTLPNGDAAGPNFQIAIGTASAASSAKDTLNFMQAQNLDSPGSLDTLGVWSTQGSAYQGGYHSTKLTIYDDNGKEHTLEVTFKKLTENRWRWEAFLVERNEESGEDELVNVVPTPRAGEIEFDGSGRISSVIADSTNNQRRGLSERFPNAEVEITLPFSLNGQPNSVVTLNFGGGVGSGGTALEGVTQFASETTTKPVYQDGYTMGVLKQYSVSTNGTITGTYDNGINIPLYRVALATFANEQGLEKVGNTMFQATVNSGNANIDGAEVNGKGSIMSQYLEMSNVDLTEEFTHLIIAQRGFQANTRVITTSDQILEEVVNLKR